MIINRDEYTEHIKDKERLIEMRRLIDKIELSVNNHSLESTDFMDPYSIKLSKTILNRFLDIDYMISSGIEHGERSIIYIYPDYMYPDNFKDLVFLRIIGDVESLNHRDFLGAILSLGIKREKIGDILVHRDYADIIIKREISDFVLYNLQKVANKNIETSYVDLKDLKEASVDFKELRRFLTSMRLDVYISAAYNLSRSESLNIIKTDRVKVNWEPINKSSYELSEGDLISIKGYGRSILNSIEGRSRKDRINTVIRILL